MLDFQAEKRMFESDVECEAARLVRRGVPPFDAITQARDLVSRRRREQADREAAEDRSRG